MRGNGKRFSAVARRMMRGARRYSARPWFTPLAGLATALDSFAPLMPTQTLLVTLGALHPRRWLATGLWFALGGAAGAASMALVVETWIPEAVERFMAGRESGSWWHTVRERVEAHGAWALFLLTLGPWPMRTGVVLCALAGVAWFEIALALGAGRSVAFPALAWAAGRSPALFRTRAPEA